MRPFAFIIAVFLIVLSIHSMASAQEFEEERQEIMAELKELDQRREHLESRLKIFDQLSVLQRKLRATKDRLEKQAGEGKKETEQLELSLIHI